MSVDAPFDYYVAPSDAVFNDIKKKAIELWRTYDDTYGYAIEKVARIENIQNIQDNAWYIVAMFDIQNQARLFETLEPETKIEVAKMLDFVRLPL